MAPTKMGIRAAEHLRSEAEDYRSRDEVTVNAGASPGLKAGTVMGKITASGIFVRHDSGASDGSENVAGVLYEGVVGDGKQATVHTRACQVIKAHLTYEDSATANEIKAADAALTALGIIPR